MKHKTIIGLEVHIELSTNSKMFCGCSAKYFGKAPNTHTCPVCLGLPGALPVPNKKAIDACRRIGLALGCKLLKFSKFDRKNYFYPDLPKGYQISQYDIPFCENGKIEVGEVGKKIRIRRVHMEEDTGKLIHKGSLSLIDFNRSGVPLVEIVTEPDFSNSDEVSSFLKQLQLLVRYLNVADANMEKGEMRLEPNISLSLATNTSLPKYKVEIKNINSFKFVKKAIEYEIERQKELLASGTIPVQETRGWNELKQQTVPQRFKEESSDYRYFPEPDIPPLTISDTEIKKMHDSLPELPNERLERFKKEYGLSYSCSQFLVRNQTISTFFEESVRIGKTKGVGVLLIANFLMNKKIDILRLSPLKLVQQIEKDSKMTQLEDKDLNSAISTVIKNNQKAVADYKNGKEQVLMFLIGQVVKMYPDKINTSQVKERLTEMLSSA